MNPFLYLDNWAEPQRETRFDRCLNAEPFKIDRYRTNDGEFPSGTEYCAAFVSPSFDDAYDDLEWVRREHEVLRDLADARVPMPGLCFGSQILASALVGPEQVFVRERRETGCGEIRLTASGRDDPLTCTLPDCVPVFHWHGDEVRAGHPDVEALADSEDCGNQVWRWRKDRVWGIQPHPEFDREGSIAWRNDNADRFDRQGFDRGRLAAEAHSSDKAFGMLENFLRHAAPS